MHFRLVKSHLDRGSTWNSQDISSEREATSSRGRLLDMSKFRERVADLGAVFSDIDRRKEVRIRLNRAIYRTRENIFVAPSDIQVSTAGWLLG